MLHRHLGCLAEYLLWLTAILIVSLYFMNDEVSKSRGFRLFFALGAICLPALVLAFFSPAQSCLSPCRTCWPVLHCCCSPSPWFPRGSGRNG